MSSAPSELLVHVQQAGSVPLDAELRCSGGQLLALVGPSGSGKTTLLRAIAGLFRPGQGGISCNGQVWFDSRTGIHLDARRRRVGYVPQHFALFPHMTVLHNVMAAIEDKSRGQAILAAQALLERVNLGGLERRLPSQLSGGQQQRVAVARALAREPQVLLLDEPFSSVDRVTRERLYSELAGLKQSLSMPMVMVTHDLGEAMLLADRLTVLHHGKTLQTGNPLEVATRPDSALVARLLGMRNLYTGEVSAQRPEAGLTLMRFGQQVLDTPYRPEFAIGEFVQWVIPHDSVILHRAERPSRGEGENPLTGVVLAARSLGEITRVEMQIEGHVQAAALAFEISTHAARRNQIEAGRQVSVSLRGAAIHLIKGS